jgi:hypothetical protein
VSEVVKLIDRIEAHGFTLQCVDGRVKITGPEAPDAEVGRLLDELRRHREEVKAVLTGAVCFMCAGEWSDFTTTWGESFKVCWSCAKTA